MSVLIAVLGGISVFFLGLKTLSQSLEAIGTDVVRKIISRFTNSSLSSFFVGLVITIILQSSTVTTVMVVSFVNAQLMTLRQAIGVIFGSNIGSTLIGWIMSINAESFSGILLLFGLADGFVKKNETIKLIAKSLFALGLLFLGLQIIQKSTYFLKDSEYFIEFLSLANSHTLGGKLIAVFMGCIFTVLLQSSAVTLSLTMSFAMSNFISLETAALFVLGENIGTTTTAIFVGFRSSIAAKRAAFSHTLLNVLGVIIFFIFLDFFIVLLEKYFFHLTIPFKIALFHTFFNSCNALFFLPFIKYFEQFLIKIIPEKNIKNYETIFEQDNTYTPLTAVLKAQQEIKRMRQIIKEQFLLVQDFLQDKEINHTTSVKIQKCEQLIDDIQKELLVFFCDVIELHLSKEQTKVIQSLTRISDELENISDYLEKIAIYKINSGIEISEEKYPEVFEYYISIYNYFKQSTKFIVEKSSLKIKDLEKKGHELGLLSEEIRNNQMKLINKKEESVDTLLLFSDIVISLRKIKSHSLSILQASKNTRFL